LVLIVDDDVDVARALVRLLRAAGHPAAAVHDGDAALAFVRGGSGERLVDFVVLDLNLPGMSGFEVLTALRSDGSAAPPVAMITADPDQSTRDKATSLGAAALFRKPALDDLLPLIAAHLRSVET
jgi:DNA-binding response OmpR family regulator